MSDPAVKQLLRLLIEIIEIQVIPLHRRIRSHGTASLQLS
jgi:hypothetical protein